MVYRAMKQTGLLVAFLLITTGVLGQSLEELHKEKQKAEEEIQYTSKLLEKARLDEKLSLSRLRLINSKITQRIRLISALNAESELIQGLIDDNALVIAIMHNDLKALKEEYAEMVRFAYKHRTANDKILFLLSSDDFNQAYKRHLYLKQYTEFRKNQANTIESLQGLLSDKIEGFQKQKEEKIILLAEAERENNRLVVEKSQQNSYLKKMQQEQRSLRQKLREQQKIEQELEREIQRMIEEEARKLREQGKPGFALTPEQELIGNNFEQNKSRLPWPVERGIVTEHFGLHKHPTLKNITINNNGIDIATEPGANARAIFTGEVSRVFAIAGGNLAVIVRHGNYLTVYSNLSEVNVKAGNLVETKQNIGTVYTGTQDGGDTVLKFQVWFENRKMNPEEWLVK